MNPRALIILAMAGSAGLLLAAWGFQYFAGLAPCKLCLWQRWPHALAVAVGASILILRRPGLAALLGFLCMIFGLGVGFYHVGVEYHWWEGPMSCTATNISGLNADALMAQIMAAPLIRCDEISWSFLGLSMAAWNAIFSLILAALWAGALKNPAPTK